MKLISLLDTVSAKSRDRRRVLYEKVIILSWVFLCSINPALSTPSSSRKSPALPVFSVVMFFLPVIPVGARQGPWQLRFHTQQSGGAWIRYILQKDENLAIKEQILGGSTQKQVYFVMCWWDGQHCCMNQSKTRSCPQGQTLWRSETAQRLRAASWARSPCRESPALCFPSGPWKGVL